MLVMIKAEISMDSGDGSRNVPIGIAVRRLPESLLHKKSKEVCSRCTQGYGHAHPLVLT
ncbi:uncharacterized protein FOMMEDRAFT_16379 [Fomitiporia mediterranea MF3/22]|uniref:uncharacterized protein n=1 Tax=Fomitiporia mediterranea (strain MF3/22) TaxID=694068 RepID=UPI00044076AA|nr:uncharacterized protein FOMMEDRAFT_16379 [Fomitiporia mediterranea MF3/22]EJD07774.1 hypothetical protein FOMMEDRAFT_16379 [Fomitiporia mediterranea MF3/22]